MGRKWERAAATLCSTVSCRRCVCDVSSSRDCTVPHGSEYSQYPVWVLSEPCVGTLCTRGVGAQSLSTGRTLPPTSAAGLGTTLLTTSAPGLAHLVLEEGRDDEVEQQHGDDKVERNEDEALQWHGGHLRRGALS